MKKSHGSVTMTLNAVRPRRNVVTKRRFRLTGSQSQWIEILWRNRKQSKNLYKRSWPKTHTGKREKESLPARKHWKRRGFLFGRRNSKQILQHFWSFSIDGELIQVYTACLWNCFLFFIFFFLLTWTWIARLKERFRSKGTWKENLFVFR